MSITVIYDIRLFHWNANTRTLHGDGWDISIENKSPFIIENSKSKGFRRFVFHKEKPGYWIFKSEDDIFCAICLDPNWEYDDVWLQ